MYKYGVKHEYSEISTYTITISGTNITHLNCMNHEVNNPFTSLDVSKDTELISLLCTFNRLKSLDRNEKRMEGNNQMIESLPTTGGLAQ